MDPESLQSLLEQVRDGGVNVADALSRLGHMPYEDIGIARLDGHRALRKGFPEVVLCQHKTPRQVAEIMDRLAARHDRILGTRATPEMYEAVRERLPQARWDEDARLVLLGDDPPLRTEARIVVATGGTSDIPVAREAMVTARWLGCPVDPLFDVGVAGIHRLLHHLPQLREASAVVAVAGMEGALPSVLAGLVACPVIGVPTSVGYGSHFGGLAPLLAMLNSCATGVAVVNIDNGFGAGVMAALIAGGAGREAKGGPREASWQEREARGGAGEASQSDREAAGLEDRPH